MVRRVNEARKRNWEARDAEREPCLCTDAGAAMLVQESQKVARDALQKLSHANTLLEWLRKKREKAGTEGVGSQGVQGSESDASISGDEE